METGMAQSKLESASARIRKVSITLDQAEDGAVLAREFHSPALEGNSRKSRRDSRPKQGNI